MQTMTTESKRIMVLVPRRKKVASFMRKVRAFNRFFDIQHIDDMVIFYGVVTVALIAGAISVNAIIQALLIG